MNRDVVPAALTYGRIGGLLFQTMMQGTGLAMLEVHKKALAPVFVGDSVWATVQVTDMRPTSKLGRGILTSQVEVYNQKNEAVISYRIVRLVAGRDPAH